MSVSRTRLNDSRCHYEAVDGRSTQVSEPVSDSNFFGASPQMAYISQIIDVYSGVFKLLILKATIDKNLNMIKVLL